MRNSIGGGTAKLLAAASLWMGPTGTLAGFLCATAIFAALSVPIVRLVRGKESEIPMLPAALLAFALFLPNTPVWPLFQVGVRALTG
jgi:Flp pilus assembly protein protease CpaA